MGFRMIAHKVSKAVCRLLVQPTKRRGVLKKERNCERHGWGHLLLLSTSAIESAYKIPFSVFPPLTFPIQNHRNLQLYTRDSCSHTNTSLLYILKSAESHLHKLDHVTINLSLSYFFVEDIIFASIGAKERGYKPVILWT